MTAAASAVRERLSREIGEAERAARWKEAALAAVRRFDELAQPLNVAIKAADPRAQIGVTDEVVDGHLKTLLEMGSPTVIFHWTRASLLAAGEPLPYVLRAGRGIELIEDGQRIIRTMIDLGIDGVMQSDLFWTGQERVVLAGSVEQEAALHEAIEELAAKLQEALTLFAQRAPSS